MNTVFMNYENSKTFDRHRLLLNLTDKIDLRQKDEYIALSNPSIYYTWKNIKKSHIRRTINLKYWPQHGMKNLIYLMDHILHQIFKIILVIYKKKHGEKTVNPSIRIYMNKVENRIMFEIKAGYYLEHLTHETMKLLESTKSKIT